MKQTASKPASTLSTIQPKLAGLFCRASWHLRKNPRAIAVYDLAIQLTDGGERKFHLSIRQVAEYFGCGKDTVRSAFQRCEKEGLSTLVRRGRGGKPGMLEFANTYQIKTHTQLKCDGRYKCLSPAPETGTGVCCKSGAGVYPKSDSTPTQNPTLVSDVESPKESSERVSKPNSARSLKSESKPSGKKKGLGDFPPVLETREEREEFRACLREMREAMNTTSVRKMEEDTEDGDVSELDAIPELDLATTPELDLSNIPEWTA